MHSFLSYESMMFFIFTSNVQLLFLLCLTILFYEIMGILMF